MRVLLGTCVIALVLTGCVKNVYDSTQEGQTIMDGQICQNGVCTKTKSENVTSKKVVGTWLNSEGAAPEVTPHNPPPSPYSALPNPNVR